MQHIEIERRWLLPKLIPLDWELLTIIQTYLSNPEKKTERVRHTIKNGKSIFEHQFKTPSPDGVGQIEEHQVISASEYDHLTLRASTKHQTIVKNRYVKEENGFKYEVDQFVYPVRFRILEVELFSFEQEVPMLPELGLAIEITGINELSNNKISLNPKFAIKTADKLLKTISK